MRNHTRTGSIASATGAALFLLNLVGCGASDNLPREAVSGTVSIDGKPLASGLITFLPAGADVATQGGGVIVGGKYSIAREPGLAPGKYTVVITSGEDTPEKKVDPSEMPGMPPIPAKEVVPSQYNTGSLLTAEVTAGGKNVFEFNLTRMPKGK